MKYQAFTLRNYKQISQIQSALSDEEKHAIEVVGNVLPFKVNNYVIEELIDWNNIPQDPIYQLTFPQKGMLSQTHFQEIENALSQNLSKSQSKVVANKIRYELNPHSSSQLQNIPTFDGIKLTGIQHKYRETVLFFPSNSQTCHAYCTFCFRWPQFVGIDELQFAMRETKLLTRYLKSHPEVTDVLFTGGDPMLMSAKNFETYVEPLINQQIPHLHTIRIGTKSLGYWPYKFLTDKDADDMLRIFEKIVQQGYQLAFMAHFNHPQELKTDAAKKAIQRILGTGAQIRTQSPIMRHINDSVNTWKEMWREQVKLRCIPYYMFVARDTGAQSYFAIPLERTYQIYKKAYQQISGIARTVRGPIMSANPGKVHILGNSTIGGKKVFVMQFLQSRNPDWTGQLFFTEYNPNAIWLDDLTPAFDQNQFFFEEETENEDTRIAAL